MKNEFSAIPADENNKEWVKSKLSNMVEVDQYMRSFINIPYTKKYTKEEIEYFNSQFSSRFEQVDFSNTKDLKELLKIYGWFKISDFGKEADSNAWLLVRMPIKTFNFNIIF